MNNLSINDRANLLAAKVNSTLERMEIPCDVNGFGYTENNMVIFKKGSEYSNPEIFIFIAPMMIVRGTVALAILPITRDEELSRMQSVWLRYCQARKDIKEQFPAWDEIIRLNTNTQCNVTESNIDLYEQLFKRITPQFHELYRYYQKYRADVLKLVNLENFRKNGGI